MRTPPSRSGGGWLADRPVAHKVLASVGIASLTALLVGGLALGDLQHLRDARDAELDTALPYVNALHDVGLTAKATANDERGYLLSGDPEFLTEIEERLGKVEGHLADARSAADTADETAFVDRLETEVGAWSASLQAEFDLYATDRGAAVAMAFDQTRSLRKVYEETLDTGIEAADAALMEGASYADTVSAAVWRTVVVCAVGVLLALGLGLAVARSFSRGLGRLRVAADRLAGGDLTVSVGLQQRDEIGRTAASLDTAVAELRTVMGTVVGAADSVASSSEELSASSAQISASAEETSAQSGVVAGAAEEVSRNVQTVAAGAEQMGASIREIASNAAEASEVAARAVTAAETTT
ncbi:HAMP domain-containing protein, partial [Geodermatophilus poikilotrophus]